MKLIPKPCPFCGHPPITGPADPKREGDAFGYVKCVNDACPAKPEVYDGEPVADERGTAAYVRIAIRRWNRRKA